MNPAQPSRPAGRRVGAALAIGLAAGLAGLLLSYWPAAESLESGGLDLLFLMRGVRGAPPGVCVVAIDEDSYEILGCPPGEAESSEPCAREGRPWPRSLHAALVRTLEEEGARAIVFDVLMDAPQYEESDRALAAALESAGNVVLASSVEATVDPRFVLSRLIEPHRLLADAAAAVGDVGFPVGRDKVVRRTWLMREDRPSLALAAYEVATGDRRLRVETGDRLIDYYGPGRTVETISLYQALVPHEYLPGGFFRGRIAFVGLSQPAAPGPEAKDTFFTPFRSESNPTMYGVEIHATIAANLIEGRRIRLLPRLAEAVLLLGAGILAGGVFVVLRPLLGAAALAALEGGLLAAGYAAFVGAEVWAPLVIPAAVQLPGAYVASLGWYYVTTVRERERIRRAFTFYLSPQMIERIVADPASLNLGGEEIEATALFTDVEGFTTISESMPPQETAAMLNGYFSEITADVFAEGGTLIKFIGDAVFAIWGAPLRAEDHAARACLAALAIAERERSAAKATEGAERGRHSPDGRAGGPEPLPSRWPAGVGSRAGPRLVTRIGLHSGPMLVGNLGSKQRFDYTAIGDTVNLASRIEGLNKHLGTRLLASGEAVARAGGRFRVRPLGRARVAGKQEAVGLFEILGRAEDPSPLAPSGLDRFSQALAEFEAGRFEAAARAFREANALLGGADGPAEYYLRQSETLAGAPPPEGWDGALVFETK